MIRSESIKELAVSLAKFQAEITNPKTSASNPLYNSKYAPLDEVLALVRPILGKQNLSIVQDVGGELENIKITTILMHGSGEWIESEPFILKGEQTLKGGVKVVNIQGAGSMITYAKRYQVTSILGIQGAEDDDGNHTVKGNVREEHIELTSEEAALIKLPFGKHKGKTVTEVFKSNPDYIDWFMENGTDQKLKQAFSVYAESLNESEFDSSGEELIDKVKVATIEALLLKTSTDKKTFLDFFKLDKVEYMTNLTFIQAMKTLEKKESQMPKDKAPEEMPEI